MDEYIYPALFRANADGSYTVTYPDLPGCVTEGKALPEALRLAQDALSQWLGFLADEKEPIPAATPRQQIHPSEGEFVNLIRATVRDGRAVRRTVSIPRWMDDQAAAAGLSLSRILQDALKERLRTS